MGLLTGLLRCSPYLLSAYDGFDELTMMIHNMFCETVCCMMHYVHYAASDIPKHIYTPSQCTAPMLSVAKWPKLGIEDNEVK